MRRILMSASLFCLLAATTSAQSVHSNEPPPPVPLTLTQLLKAQARTLQGVEQVGYKKRWRYETLTVEGARTGLRSGEWELLWLGGRASRKTLRDEGSTGSGLSLPGEGLAEFSRWVGGFFSPDCLTKFSGYEERQGRLLLRYRTHYLGGRSCFDGLTWVDENGTVLEAEGRREPYRVRDAEGRESLWPRCRVWMRADGLPDRVEADDVLVLSVDQPGGYERDKNGKVVPRRVRVRHESRYYDYRRYRPEEPRVIEQGDVP